MSTQSIKTAAAQVAIIPSEETINRAVVPKPKKHEVVEAVARVRRAKLVVEQDRAKTEADKREAVLKSKVRKFVEKSIRTLTQDIRLGSYYSSDGTLRWVRSEIDLVNSLPEDLKRELIAHQKTVIPSVPELSEIKREVRAGIDCSPCGTEARISALINNPASRKALEKMLVEIGVDENSAALESEGAL